MNPRLTPAERVANNAANKKANTRARLVAAAWVRDEFPGMWRRILANEREAVGLSPTTPQSQNLGES